MKSINFRLPEEIKQAQQDIIKVLIAMPMVHSREVVKALPLASVAQIRADLAHMSERGQLFKHRDGGIWLWSVNHDWSPLGRRIKVGDDPLPVRQYIKKAVPSVRIELPKFSDPWDWMIHHLVPNTRLVKRM